MLIEHIFENENPSIPDEVYEKIRNSEFFKINYENWLHDKSRDIDDDPYKKLYRGMNVEKNITTIKPYKKRQPLDTIPQYHHFVNSKSEDVLGLRVRDLIFSRLYAGQVKVYGNPYILFPIGDYEIYYHEETRDFTSNYDTDIKLSTHVMRTIRGVWGDLKAYKDVVMEVGELIDGVEVKDYKSFRKQINENLSKVADLVYENALKVYDKVVISKEEFYKRMSTRMNTALNSIEKYIENMKVTKHVKDVDWTEAMIKAPEIIAISFKLENEFFIEMTKRYRDAN